MKFLTAVLLTAIFLIPLSVDAKQSVVEKWDCTPPLNSLNAGMHIATALVFADRHSGEIHVAGVDYKTTYQVKGFDRYWYFGFANGKPSYAVRIMPNDMGFYYDFTNSKKDQSVAPTMTMDCTQDSPSTKGKSK